MSRRSGQDPDSRCEEGGNEEKREERVLCKGEGRNTRVLACAALVRKEEEGGIGRMGSMGEEGGEQKVGRGWAGEGGVGVYAGRGIGRREGREGFLKKMFLWGLSCIRGNCARS